MHHPLFLSVWRPSCMTNPIDARPTLNTAPKDGSLARPLSTTGAGKYGRLPHVALALPQQCSSNTSTSPIHPCPRPMPSSLQQPILPMSLSTMPRHSTDTAKQQLLSPTPTKPVTPHTPPPRVQAHSPIPTACTPPPTSPVVSDDEDSDDEMAPLPRVPTRRPIPLIPCPQPTTTTPALNTRSRTRFLTHETMLHVLATRHIGITAAQATQRRSRSPQ
eukprot:CCRYP_001765-RA/>CCRYP_001765-RA protein AED:0.43 eAED:0.41 QI:0/0/0/1/0/0/2/0/217